MLLNPHPASPFLPYLSLSFFPGSLHISGCLPSTVQACEREAERQWGMGLWVVLLVVAMVRRGGGGGRKAWVNRGRWERKKKRNLWGIIISGRAVALSLRECVSVCVVFFFCNFIQFGRSRRSARVNNSLQSADVITFWQTSQSGLTFPVLTHTHLALQLCIYSSSPSRSDHEQRMLEKYAICIIWRSLFYTNEVYRS